MSERVLKHMRILGPICLSYVPFHADGVLDTQTMVISNVCDWIRYIRNIY